MVDHDSDVVSQMSNHWDCEPEEPCRRAFPAWSSHSVSARDGQALSCALCPSGATGAAVLGLVASLATSRAVTPA